MLQTEFQFCLPIGFRDAEGQVHRQGTMRLATALDEIAPLQDPRVRINEAYLTIILLSQVITQLGPLRQVSTKVVESFFAADLAYLEAFYRHVNKDNQALLEMVVCPKCYHQFEPETALEVQ